MAVYPDIALEVPAQEPEKFVQRFETVVSRYGGGRELRKQKLLFPLYDVTLRYQKITTGQAALLWQFHRERKGAFEEFSYYRFQEQAYASEYVGVGNGEQTIWNAPARQALSVEVHFDGTRLTDGADYAYEPGAGVDGADRIVFAAAPAAGGYITMSFYGRLKMRCRFAEDVLDFETWYGRLVDSGVKLRGLPNA
ncbi:DUF2460 domain-containing protein [Desulfocurvibacter africanus]|uniref:DUF2460 domain-containing protein n=1 Tax=Desulfocurvibacter africanus subsp. africanus str. Walvis Bay TaxID=690850 RepID=F3YY24_DESAF|nr:DUF2460 domain-containing protein [Desulfocurvibacter africanus]EGJ51800.1 hypothetical protein Desaf_3517 [Desulfocurvibacter africanus subsp. africanus str. Walvis Bay]